jgi:hypothetical protein
MKSFIKVLSLVFALSFIACQSAPKEEEGVTVDSNSVAYTATYVCPMHCEGSGDEEQGKCPSCSMDYEINPRAVHAHEAKTTDTVLVADSVSAQ